MQRRKFLQLISGAAAGTLVAPVLAKAIEEPVAPALLPVAPSLEHAFPLPVPTSPFIVRCCYDYCLTANFNRKKDREEGQDIFGRTMSIRTEAVFDHDFEMLAVSVWSEKQGVSVYVDSNHGYLGISDCNMMPVPWAARTFKRGERCPVVFHSRSRQHCQCVLHGYALMR